MYVCVYEPFELSMYLTKYTSIYLSICRSVDLSVLGDCVFLGLSVMLGYSVTPLKTRQRAKTAEFSGAGVLQAQAWVQLGFRA